MIGPTARGYARRIPFKIPDAVSKRMDRLHPSVQLVWDHKHQKIAMLCLERDGYWSILGGMEFDPPITLAKTVYKLNDAMMPAQMSQPEQDSFLSGLDKQRELDEASCSVVSDELISEGSDRLAHLLKPRTLITKPSDVRAAERQIARDSRKRKSQRPR